jgi:nitroreductase
MNTLLKLAALMALTLLPFPADAESPPLALPAPQTAGGKPLMQVLRDRQSRREFSTNTLPLQTLANLLWAGFGTNRLDGRRTAPSTMNCQVMDLYVATADGVARYDATTHALCPVASGDLRSKTGGQDYVKTAPVALILVADLSRMEKAKPEDRERYAAIDAGCITQNLYLFCAAEGLATVVHEMDRRELPALLHLKPEQRIMLAQSVGFPK